VILEFILDMVPIEKWYNSELICNNWDLSIALYIARLEASYGCEFEAQGNSLVILELILGQY